MRNLGHFLPSGFLGRLLSFLSLTAVAIFALGVYMASSDAKLDIQEEERGRLTSIVTAVAPSLDGDLHRRLLLAFPEIDDIRDWYAHGPELQLLHEDLAALERRTSLHSPVYTLRVRDEALEAIQAQPDRVHADALEFLVSSSETPYWRHRFDYVPQMRSALLEGKPSSTEIYTTRSGTWVSAFAPVLDSDGELAALLEVDTPMGSLLARSSDRLWTRASTWAGLFCLVIAAVALISYTMTSELRSLERATRRLSHGDFATPVETTSGIREVQALARTLDQARRRISNQIENQELLNGELFLARVEAEGASDAKSRFLANMSHEIRTPMNGIIGMVELLSDTDLNEEQRDLVRTLDTSGESLLTLLNDILDFSKIEAGKLSLEAVEVDLRACVEDTVELLATRAQSKRLETHCFLPEELPAHFRGDPGRLRQVLLNLVGNAIKFTEEGEVVVSVKGRPASPDTYSLRFEVRDSGIGICAADQQRLFSPFTQADESTTRRFGGTGLGLAISRQLVELMGGRIGVESEPGEGSTFWFTLELPVMEGEGDDRPPLEALRGKRVLVVDDNETSRKILGHHLGAQGVACDFAENGEQALQRVRVELGLNRSYDLVLTDLLMPGVDGMGLAHELLRMEGFEAPVAAISAYVDALRGADEARSCFQRVLSKPVRRAQLLRTVAQLVGGSPLEPPAALPAPAAEPAVQAVTPRVLIAEDNPVNQKVIGRLVRRAGYEPVVVDDGRQAVERLTEGDFALVLMDCQMPEMDGYEATRRIRALPGPLGTTPVLGLSAHVIQEYRERGLAAGMDDYLQKPIRLKVLAAALERWCDAQSSRAPLDR